MEKNKLSVIVIIYKVSQYIDRCLESIVNQTYRNLEIILVVGEDPNGHDDGCMGICRKYAAEDSRIKIITCKAAGPADARNRGLAAVTGELIGFVDGDDYIDRDMYTSMAAAMVQNKAQIAVCGKYYEYRNTTIPDPFAKNGVKVMNGEQALTTVLSGDGFYLHCWDKLFRAKLWNDITFPEDCYVEDRIVVDKVLAKAGRIVYDPTPKYHFRQRSGSLSKDANMARYNTEANRELAGFVTEKFPRLSLLCDKYMIYEYITAIQNIYISGDINEEELLVYRTELGELSDRSMANPNVDWKLKSKIILAFYAPRMLAWNTKRKNRKTSKQLIKYA